MEPQPPAPREYRPWRLRLKLVSGAVRNLFRSRAALPVNGLSDQGLACMMRYMYARTKMIATVVIKSGSERNGRFAWASNYAGAGDKGTEPTTGAVKLKPSAASQVTPVPAMNAKSFGGAGNLKGVTIEYRDPFWVQCGITGFGAGGRIDAYVKRLFDTTAALRDLGVKSPETAPGPKLNVAHIIARWSARANYWDPISQTSKPRDAARIHQENTNLADFISDMLVLDSRYEPGCPRIPIGQEVSHCGESYHNEADWQTLQFTLCSFTHVATTPKYSGDAARMQEFRQWTPGKKVELVAFEENEVNVSRQICSRFQLHWLEIDGEVVRADGPRTLRVLRPKWDDIPPGGEEEAGEMVVFAQEISDRFPTSCPHSQARMPGMDPTPCFGPRAGVIDRQDPTGLSPFRPRAAGEAVSPGPGSGIVGQFPLPGYRPAAATPPPG